MPHISELQKAAHKLRIESTLSRANWQLLMTAIEPLIDAGYNNQTEDYAVELDAQTRHVFHERFWGQGCRTGLLAAKPTDQDMYAHPCRVSSIMANPVFRINSIIDRALVNTIMTKQHIQEQRKRNTASTARSFRLGASSLRHRKTKLRIQAQRSNEKVTAGAAAHATLAEWDVALDADACQDSPTTIAITLTFNIATILSEVTFSEVMSEILHWA